MNLETLERSANVMKVWWQSRFHYDPACSLWEKTYTSHRSKANREVRDETIADPKPDESADDHAGYSRFADGEGNDLDSTSMEVFWNDADGPFSLRGDECEECEGTGKGELPAGSCEACEGHGSPALESGWYWWACYPGCLADGEPCGPFSTSTEAYENGRS